MNYELQEQVTAIATDVRFRIQRKADSLDYNPDDLNGWCAIASAWLHRELARVKIKSSLHLWRGDHGSHVFLVVDDHVVDITATQFSEFAGAPVVILHSKEAQVYEFYNTSEQFNTVKDLQKYQQKRRWPQEQIAYTN